MILTFFRNLENQKNQSKKKNKALTQSTKYNAVILLNARKKVFNAFESRIFP